MVEERGFEPLKAKPADLQSALVDRLSTPPRTHKTPILRASRQTLDRIAGFLSPGYGALRQNHGAE